MTEQHPITPSLERLEKWNNLSLSTEEIFVIAAQWGADQELEASVAWLDKYGIGWTGLEKFRNARRPKPPSLKEEAHDAYSVLRYGHGGDINETQKWNTIRRALEALPND